MLNRKIADYWEKLKLKYPRIYLQWAITAGALFLFYLIILLPLDYAVASNQQHINQEKKQIEWMTPTATEITRLRQILPHQKNKGDLFALVNQAINKQGWNTLVTNIRQLEQNRVQIDFKAISFQDLMRWLQTLYAQNGIYVLEANMQKTQIGVVQATLILQ